MDGNFIAGFVGRFCEQKGWKALLSAMERLPDNFKAVLIGDGEQRSELETLLKKPGLKQRVHCAGLLPKESLLAT